MAVSVVFRPHCIPRVVETGDSFNSDWAMELISVVHHNHDCVVCPREP